MFQSLRTDESSDTQEQSRRGLVGRRPGPQPKRKAEEDLSQNVNTKRSRQQMATFTAQEKEIEMAKKADNSALGYVTSKYKKSNVFNNVTEKERLQDFLLILGLRR